MLLFVALGAFEPVGGLVAHDMRDFSFPVEFADAIGTVVLAELVTVRGEQRFGRLGEDRQSEQHRPMDDEAHWPRV